MKKIILLFLIFITPSICFSGVGLSGGASGVVDGSRITGTVQESVIDSDIARDSEVTSAVSTKQDTITSSTDLTIKDLTADSVTTNFTDGLAGSFWNNYNTSTPTLTGKMGIWPEYDGMHFSNDGTDGGVIGTGGSSSNLDTTNFAGTAIVDTSEALSQGPTDLMIPTWGAVLAKLNDLLVAGNPSIAITTPAADETWVDSLTYTSFAGTAFDLQGISAIEWKLESGGTYADTGVTGTTNWSVASITLQEGANELYARVTDTSANTAEAHITLNADSTAPVGVADADGTHSGTEDSITSGIDWTENYIDASTITCTVVNATPTNPTITTVGNASDTEALTPDGTGTVTCTWAADDLAGNSATGTDLVQEFTYDSGSEYTTSFSADWGCSNTTDAATCDGWTSETDTGSIGSISSNAYVIAMDGANATYLSKTFSADNTDYQITLKIKLASITGVDTQGISKSIEVVQVRSSAGSFLRIFSECDSSGSVVRFRTTRYDDAGSSTSSTTDFTPSTDTYVTITIQSDIGVASTSDGVLYVSADSTELLNLTGLATETRPVMSELRVGIVYREWNQSNTLTIDDVAVGYK